MGKQIRGDLLAENRALRGEIEQKNRALRTLERRIESIQNELRAIKQPIISEDCRRPIEAKARIKSDVLWGYEDIGEFIGLGPRQAKHRALKGGLPVFKVGRLVAATKTGLREWFAKQMLSAENNGGN